MNAERQRMEDGRDGKARWSDWGPYLAERQWGTVREDYSPDGLAWTYLPHDHARSRAYRWGEDGIAGFSDDQQRLCLALTVWNGRDPILKERLFGLTNGQGNHGEDVKELYYYLDATPSHSYLKMLYKYPHAAFPYEQLLRENAARGKDDPEFELLDTGLFDQDAYFDVFIEYARADVEDLCWRITACNRGDTPAELHLLPTAWFRNTWSWKPEGPRGRIAAAGTGVVKIEHEQLGTCYLHADGPAEWLFCENETNTRRLFGSAEGPAHPKDGFHRRLIEGESGAVNDHGEGTKAAAHWCAAVDAGREFTVRLRLCRARRDEAFKDFDDVCRRRRAEADEFYADLQAEMADDDEKLVQRQALAGMIWSKQFYYVDIPEWLAGDPLQPPPPPRRRQGRNWEWAHLNNADVLSMPDTWEYPWYAAWDLAFHCLPLALIDADFAKHQLVLLTREWYMHPNGQLPAYEFDFGAVNPPVHAWATWRVFQIDRKQRGDDGDLAFLERVFHKLMLNFTWWVNRKDALGHNVFQGGFLGLDNIGVFDRSAALPTGGHINQADATSWMAMYCLNLMRIALELALHNPVYQDIATKFFEHFLHIAEAITNFGGAGVGLWDEQDEFYYDYIRLPEGTTLPLKARSIVGLIPLFAVETIEPEMLDALPDFARRLRWFLNYRPDLASLVSRWNEPGRGERRLLSLLRGHRMKRLLSRALDESEFLSPFGVRGLSKAHEAEPYRFRCDHCDVTVRYEPGESRSGMFGGNSNWRGPVWMPVNYLIIESLQKFHHYYTDDFRIECPAGSGQYATILGASQEITRRLTRLFVRDEHGRRAVFGDKEKLQTDPHFRDYVPFYEYFHGDTGRGCGASHQTGWTGLIAKLLVPRRGE